MSKTRERDSEEMQRLFKEIEMDDERLKESLREHGQLISILDSMDEVVYIADPNTHELLYTNRVFRRNWGKGIGKRCYQVLQNRDRPCPFCTNHRIFGENLGETYTWEFQNEVTRRWYRCIDRAIEWPDGRMVRFEMAIDVSDSKKAEEALAKSEEKFKAIFECAALGIAVSDPTGRIIDCNSSYQEMLGYTKEELRQRTFLELTHPDDVSKNEELLHQEAEGMIDRYQLEKRYIRKDGRVIWVNVVSSAIRDSEGTLQHNMAVFEDITERKRAEDQLNYHSKLLESVSDAIISVGKDYSILSWNKAAGSIYGYTREEVIGKSISDILHTEYHGDSFEGAAKKIESDGAWSGEVTQRRKDGSILNIQSSVSMVRDAFGGPVLVAVNRDITRQRMAQESLDKAHAELRKERDLLQTVMNGARKSHLVYLDRNFNFVRVNEAYAKTCGYRSEEMIGKNHFDLYPHEENEVIFKRVRDTGQAVEFHDKPFVFPDQPERGVTYWDWTLEPIKDTSGRVQGLVFALMETTERKRAEEALKESEEKFSKAFHGTVAAKAIVKLSDGTIVDANERWLKSFGVAREGMVGRTGHDLLHHWENSQDRRDLARRIEEVGSIQDEEVMFRRDGGESWTALMSAQVIELKAEKVVMISLIDITDRKKAEQALRHSEIGLKEAERIAGVGNWEWTIEGDKMIWSDGLYDIAGIANDRAAPSYGENPDFYTKESWTRLDLAVKHALATGEPYELEIEMIRPDGAHRWLDARGEAARDLSGRITGLRGTVHDITDRKEMEEALKLAQASIDHAADDILWATPNGKISYANEAACRSLGYSKEELTGKHIWDFDPLYTKEVMEEHWLEIKKRGSFTFETIHRAKDGREFPVEVSVNYVAFGDKEFNFAYIKDITERKRAEEALKRSNDDLQQFAYVASHDLKEPLRMVSTFVALLDKKYGDQLNDEAKEYIQFAMQGSERMKEMIDDLLEYSRVETRGKEFELTDMNEVVDQALLNLKAQTEETQAIIEVGKLPDIFADSGQMIQLFQNLISNAIKFRGEETPKIEISSILLGNRWIFAVKDNGIGISPKYQERIFEMFQRLHTREEYEGTGIGLAVCKKIVERHGGLIWVESEEGKGSTFFFTLPNKI